MGSPGRAGRRQLTWILRLQENDPAMRASGGSPFRFRSRPPRQLTCPYCQACFSLPETARSYVCLCGQVLRIGASSAPLVQVRCGLCGSGWGAQADAGSMTCHGCGSQVALANGVASVGPFDGTCSGCGAAVCASAYFCQQCGALLARPYLDVPPVSPSSPMSEPRAATLPDYADASLAAELPAGFTRAAMTANSPAGYLAHACWLAELTRREIVGAGAGSIDYFRFLQLMGRVDHAIACLGLAVDEDERYADAARSLLGGLELLASAVVRLAVDEGSGALTGWTDASNYHGPLRPRFQQVLSAVAADRNIVRHQTGVNQEQIVPWREPLFEVEPGQTGTSRRPNGMFVPTVSLRVKGWAALNAGERLLARPADALAAMPPFAMPAGVLAFMSTPAEVRVAPPAPALFFSEDV